MKSRVITGLAIAAITVGAISAQTDGVHQHTSSSEPNELAAQLEDLRDKVQHLERQIQSGTNPGSMSDMNMSDTQSGGMEMKGMMDGMKGMGMMKTGGKGGMSSNTDSMSKMNMTGSQSASMGMMSGMDGMMMSRDSGSMKGMTGMGMMGMMKGKGGMSGMAMQSALPGFPGASHIYHIGATGFFLDHGDHIQLTPAQQSALARIKERSVLEQATAERKIDEAEQQLWQLTAADSPDAKAIEVKIREIEKLRGDQRMTYIRAVGEAAETLTHEQHKILTGTQSSNEPNAHTNHQP